MLAERSRRPLLALTLGVVALTACRDESGSARAFGTLQIPYCSEHRPYNSGSRDQPSDEYDLGPRFIGGEPFEDVRSPPRTNRLVLRLQSTGKRVESNDVLSFDFIDSYEVARCLGGGTRPDGSVDYDPAVCVPTTRLHGGEQLRGAVVRLGIDTPLRAYFMPRRTCPDAYDDPHEYVATAVSSWPASAPPPPGPSARTPLPERPPEAPEGWESWIDLVAFGGAERWRGQTCDEDCAAHRRQFKVDFGEEIVAAAYHLLMLDDRYVKRLKDGEPPGRPEIAARLQGDFSLELERGQGAQTFP